jgi:hypothetical protein
MSDRFGTDLLNLGVSPMRLEQPDAVQLMRSTTTSRYIRLSDEGDAGHELNRRRTQHIDGSPHPHCDPEFDPAL